MVKYWTLFERDEYGLWWPQFGDYDRDAVEAERNDWVAAGLSNPACLEVVSTPTDAQSDIDAAARTLSGF